MSDEFNRALSRQVKHHCQQAAQHHMADALVAFAYASVLADDFNLRGASEEMRVATVGLLKAAAWSALAGMVRG